MLLLSYICDTGVDVDVERSESSCQPQSYLVASRCAHRQHWYLTSQRPDAMTSQYYAQDLFPSQSQAQQFHTYLLHNRSLILGTTDSILLAMFSAHLLPQVHCFCSSNDPIFLLPPHHQPVPTKQPDADISAFLSRLKDCSFICLVPKIGLPVSALPSRPLYITYGL